METAYTALAAGRGDSAMIRLLQEAQQSKHTMLPHSVKLCCLLDIVPLAESGAEEVQHTPRGGRIRSRPAAFSRESTPTCWGT